MRPLRCSLQPWVEFSEDEKIPFEGNGLTFLVFFGGSMSFLLSDVAQWDS